MDNEEIEKTDDEAVTKPVDGGGEGGGEGGEQVVTNEEALFKPQDENQAAWADETYGTAVAKVMSDAGVNAHAANEYFQANGTLPDAAFEKLAAAGFKREVVEAYISGVDAKKDSAVKEAEAATEEQTKNAKLYAHEPVGGPDAYTKMTKWAAQNYTKDEIADFNKAINSNDPASMRLAATSLRARFEGANGKLPARDLKNSVKEVPGAKVDPAAGDVFKSASDLVAAQKDPRYSRDAAYTKEVNAKQVRSNLFGHVRRA